MSRHIVLALLAATVVTLCASAPCGPCTAQQQATLCSSCASNAFVCAAGPALGGCGDSTAWTNTPACTSCCSCSDATTAAPTTTTTTSAPATPTTTTTQAPTTTAAASNCPTWGSTTGPTCTADQDCCGYSTMSPRCIDKDSGNQCCTWFKSATTCNASQSCCGQGGTGASSFAFCCNEGSSCCTSQSGTTGSSTCCPAGSTCCKASGVGLCCGPDEVCNVNGNRCDKIASSTTTTTTAAPTTSAPTPAPAGTCGACTAQQKAAFCSSCAANAFVCTAGAAAGGCGDSTAWTNTPACTSCCNCGGTAEREAAVQDRRAMQAQAVTDSMSAAPTTVALWTGAAAVFVALALARLG